MTKFFLQVQRVENQCLFQLSWSSNQKIIAELPYPENLISDYQNWQRIYHIFYSQQSRGKIINTGVVAPPPVDWQGKLVQSEAKLLYEFHQWLRSKELYDIRTILTKDNSYKIDAMTDIFISCNTLELTRLPWESWEISNHFSTNKLRITRQAFNIHQDAITVYRNKNNHNKIRILAIFGDENGLDFSTEKQAILALKNNIEVDLITWQEGKDIHQFKYEIIEALTHTKGWDILYFAGHSRETDLTGGEISIAPHATINLNEIEKSLTTAITNRLKFALFNSCDGLSIANKLIELGLNQVAIMREPIHNQVAEEIFVQFLQQIAQYQDVHQALLSACDYLKLEKNLTYPSAHLIPSLFRHPEASLFSLQPRGIQASIKWFKPTPLEVIIISAFALISLQLPVQTWLLERRVLAQAIYRNLTNQAHVNPEKKPPILLVQIDNESINQAGILSPRPINRQYMARIVDKLVELKAPIIGIDYLLDRPDLKRDLILHKSLQTGLKSRPQPTRFIFATTRDTQGKWLTIHPRIASHNWSLAGEIEVLPGWYMQLLPRDQSQSQPLAYVLAISQKLQQFSNAPQAQLTSKQDLWEQVNTYIHQNSITKKKLIPNRARLKPITAFSYNLQQMWLHPIVDFSLPPKQVYETISAWKLLDSPPKLQQQIMMIAPGGYEEAGVGQDNEDNFELPAAIVYWRNQDNPDRTRGVLTAGEVHAYMTHHYLNDRMVVPIPDLWMILVGVVLGKFSSAYLSNNPEQRGQRVILLSVGYTAYILVSLQLYISATAILVPLLLPTLTLCLYVLPLIVSSDNKSTNS